MKLIEHLKAHWNNYSQWDRVEMIKTLHKAQKELMIDIQKNTNGTTKYLEKVYPIIKEFFGE